MPVNIEDVKALVDAQEEWRGHQTINLIASENAQSPAVRAIQDSDFMARYAEGHPNHGSEVRRYYQGTRYIDDIENMAREELLALTRCRQADVRPISGNNANTAIALAYLRGGDSIIVNSTPAGGHISHNTIGVFGRRIQSRGLSLNLDNAKPIPMHFFPRTEDGYHIDTAKAIDLIEQASPRLIVLGKSLFLFPEPVRELAEVCKAKGIAVLYDAAHVFGLIVGGQFQDPWREGATWVTASTHKTFPGPQRGVIVSDLDQEDAAKYWPAADRGVFPGSSSNHHLHSLPALLVAIREMQAHALTYAGQIVYNAQALGATLDDAGIAVEARDFGYTKSHQIAVHVGLYGGGVTVAKRLEDNDIIVNYNLLPGDTDARNPNGLRIGVQEMTRYGMKEAEMQRLAELIAGAIKGSNVKAEVNKLRADFPELQYTSPEALKTGAMMSRLLSLATVLMLIATTSTLVARAEAQQPGIFEVVIPAASLNLPVTGSPGIRTQGQFQGSMTAQANGVTCVTADLSSMTSDVLLQLGLPGQPAACSMDGAKVTFFNGRCHPMATEMVLVKGTRLSLDNLAPKPPGTTPPPAGCIPLPDPTPVARSQPAPQLPPGGIAPPPGLVPPMPSAPAIVPPQTGDAGLAGER